MVSRDRRREIRRDARPYRGPRPRPQDTGSREAGRQRAGRALSLLDDESLSNAYDSRPGYLLQEASRLNIIAGSLLLVLPVPFRRDGETLSFESQACNGLNCWADNFARVIVACPLEPADVTRQRKSSETYLPIDSIPARDRIEFVPLPWGHGVGEFARQYRRTRRLLADKIRRSQFLSFA